METGTEILLQRMKDCPEEFRGTLSHKWDRLMRDAKEYLPTEDVEALDAGIRQINIDLFNERVLRTLAGEGEPESNVIYKAKERYAGGFTDARGLIGGAVAKAEGTFVGTLQDHAAQHQQMVLEREEQIQKEMRAKVAMGAQNSIAGGWWTK